ncbi:MAG: 3'-5' exonuclease DinG [Candidatus Celerinatantimonas neptuna]|nr:MAG: 3'-5' exonuclease DinG [Candidatus Celerinatantimonas neptuna]
MSEFKVAVRALCELVATQGSLDSRFLPAVSGLVGISAQKRYQKKQAESYQSEVVLSGLWQKDGHHLILEGRADGVDETEGVIEEIKTLKVSADQVPESARYLHWAQLKVYGFLWCEWRKQPQIALHLTYLDESGHLLKQLDTVYQHMQDRDEVDRWFDRYLTWRLLYQQQILVRNASLVDLQFPCLPFRPGQRRLAKSVYHTVQSASQLLVEAPTGIGKTLATIYPSCLLLGKSIDRIVYLTAKNSTQSLPLDALTRLNRNGAHLRAIVLSGKQRACLNPGAMCQPQCLYAAEFYNKFHTLFDVLMGESQLDGDRLRRLGEQHQICPYYLAMMLAPWFDVVVGDYNYGFDSQGALSWLNEPLGGCYALLVDEAHNLLERARSLYSAQVNGAHLKRLSRDSGMPEPIAKSVKSLRRQFSALVNELKDIQGELLSIEIPKALLRSARRFSLAIEQALSDAVILDERVMELYFDVYKLLERSELFAEHYQYQLARRERVSVVKIDCLDVAPELKLRFAKAHACILFSATLHPLASSARALGLEDEHYQLVLPSPYRASQQGIWLLSDINTRYRYRQFSYARLADLIASSFQAHQGNQLVFFPSFDYLQSVAELVEDTLPIVCQTRQMNDKERHQFLEKLASLESPCIGLVVLGGIFSEGIDLPGQQLSSAMIVGVGLAQFNAENEHRRDYLQTQGEDGFALVYRYPGMHRVVQAAGRVIRSADDWGTIILADDRYIQSDYQSLLPEHWVCHTCQSTQLPEQLRAFWKRATLDEPSLPEDFPSE